MAKRGKTPSSPPATSRAARAGFAGGATLLGATPALAAEPLATAGTWGWAAALAATLAALLAWRGAARHKARAAALARELEDNNRHCEEVELLLRAEPQALIVWENGEGEPTRQFVHDMMRDVIPPPDEGLADFHHWLEEEAAQELKERLKELLARGEPFNIAVRSADGHLLEADGRPVGARALLRLRPLQGERLNAEEQAYEIRRLSDHARRITGLLARSPVPVWITDAEGRLKWANAAWLELAGVESLDIARAENAALLGQGELAAATLLPEHGEWKRYLASTVIDAQRRHFEIWERPHDVGHVHWALEVSERELLGEQLQHHRATFSRIFDHLQTAIAIFDTQRRLSFFNRAFARLWELEEGWLEQRPHAEEILNRLFDAGSIAPEGDFAEWRQQWLRMHGDMTARRERWQLPDGRVIEVIAEPNAGEGVVYLFEDMTERLRLQARYQESLHVQRATLDNLREVVAVFGTDGRLKLSNPTFAEVWRLAPEEIAARPHVDAFIDKARALIADARWWDDLKYCVTDLEFRSESRAGRITRTDGRVFDYRIVPLPDGNTLITWYEMTDAVRAEQAARERAEALEESDRVKAAFLDSISYELRTPLTTINGYSEMMQMGMGGPLSGQQQQYLRHIRAASGELLEKIDTVLDLTAIDAGRMSLEARRFDVLDMFRELAAHVEERLARRDMALDIEVAADVERLEADRTRLMQALKHLLANAIGFGRPGTTVRMGARRKGRNVEFWVADEGPGMDAESLQKAFERFFSRPSPEGHRGPGLGLPLVKALIELHGGEVAIVSREGAGTTVICRLPEAAAQEARA